MIQGDKSDVTPRLCRTRGLVLLLLCAGGPAAAQTDLSEAHRSLSPSVIRLDATLPDGSQTAGIGVVLSRSGLALAAGAPLSGTQLQAIFSDGRTSEVVPVVEWEADRLGLVQLKNTRGLSVAVLGAGAPPPVGSPLLALARDGPRLVASAGIVADAPQGKGPAETVRFDRPLSAPGLLTDTNGRVLGLTAGSPGPMAIVFTARALAARLEQALGPRAHLRLAHGATFAPTADGLVVERIRLPSPAAAAGIRREDVVLSIGLLPVKSDLDVWLALAAQPVALTVPVKVKRGAGQKMLFLKPQSTAAPADDAQIEKTLGVTLDDRLTVLSVTRPAAKDRLQAGDVLVQVGGHFVATKQDLGWVVAAGTAAAGRVRRGQEPGARLVPFVVGQ